jgi:hypothetical protein
MLTHLYPDNAAIAAGFGRPWIKPDRFVQIGNSSIRVAYPRPGNATKDERLREMWIQPNCLGTVSNRAFVVGLPAFDLSRFDKRIGRLSASRDQEDYRYQADKSWEVRMVCRVAERPC